MRFIALLTIFLNIIYPQNIRVAVAANVANAVDDLKREFSKNHKNIKVFVSVGSSGKLSAQIMHGAPYDIFLSANSSYPKELFKNGIGESEPKVYAKGVLALFTAKGLDISKGLNALQSPKISKIAIANAKTAPYGEAAKEALESAKLYSKLKSKFIYGESIGQTLIFTLKAADVGIVAKSLLYSKEMSKYKEGRDFVEVDNSFYKPIEQSALLVGKSIEAKEFYNFLFSKEAKDIFKRYGYIVSE